MVNINLRDISEHDMDMLIIEEFLCNQIFRRIFYDKIGLDSSFEILDAYRSLSDSDGESDITFILSNGIKKHALLIEDKIDAETMKDQSTRYVIRAEKAKEKGVCDSYDILLVCPQEYWNEHRNDPNANYKHIVLYEDLLSVFSEKSNLREMYKFQVIKTALDAKKKGYQVFEDKAVTAFWIALRSFCDKRYPNLIMLGKNTVKGSEACWPEFKTALKRTKIVYKSDKGYVDFQIAGYGEKIGSLKGIIGNKLDDDMNIYPAKKSAAIRIKKTEWAISFKQPFVDVENIIDDVLKCVLRFIFLAEQIDYNTLF